MGLVKTMAVVSQETRAALLEKAFALRSRYELEKQNLLVELDILRSVFQQYDGVEVGVQTTHETVELMTGSNGTHTPSDSQGLMGVLSSNPSLVNAYMLNLCATRRCVSEKQTLIERMEEVALDVYAFAEANTGNIEANTGNTEANTGNIEANTGNTEANTGNTENCSSYMTSKCKLLSEQLLRVRMDNDTLLKQNQQLSERCCERNRQIANQKEEYDILLRNIRLSLDHATQETKDVEHSVRQEQKELIHTLRNNIELLLKENQELKKSFDAKQ